MRVFLAGGTGVLGRHLIPLLVAGGHEVVAPTREEMDVFDREAVLGAVREARPDVVVHQLTSLAGGDRTANAEIRTVGTRNLVDAALAAGTRRMVAQSISWAYAPGDDPAGEDEPLDLAAPAARLTSVAGVAALESAVRQLPEWVVLRYGTLYGPGTWYARDGLMTRPGALVANADVTSFVAVEDAAAAAVAALAWPAGAVNVTDDEPATGAEWVPAFCAAVGVPVPPPTEGDREGWARGASNRHAREDLGWVAAQPSWRTGFRRL